MKLEQKTIKVNGSKIHYYIYGKGSPLLFIHGHRSDTLRWKNLIYFLGQRFKIYSPDLPGFGKSPALKKWHTMSRYAEILVEFTEKIGLTNYVLFGGSMGGIIALHMLKNPNLPVRKLILLGTVYDKNCIKLGKKTRTLLSLALKTAVKSKITTFIADKIIKSDFLLYRLSKRALPLNSRNDGIIKYEMWQWRVMPSRIWMETLYDILRVNFSSEKRKILVPTLIATSKVDHYLDIKKNNEGLKKLCPNNSVAFLPFEKHVPDGELTLDEIKKLDPLFEPFLSS